MDSDSDEYVAVAAAAAGGGAGAGAGAGAGLSAAARYIREDGDDSLSDYDEDYDSGSSDSYESEDPDASELNITATLMVDDSGRRVTAVGTLDLSPPEIELEEGETPFDIAFHPLQQLIAVGGVSGRVTVFSYHTEGNTVAFDHPELHAGSCRTLQFSEDDGQFLFTAGEDRALRVLDLGAGGVVAYTHANAHTGTINTLQTYGQTMLLTGDDNGTVKLWEMRTRKPVFDIAPHTDFISSFLPMPGKHQTICLSGDGRLTILNMRRGTVDHQCEEQEDELLSGAILKGGTKVVVGTQDGTLAIWTAGQWGDMSDRFPGHPHSVDALIKIDEESICTGSSDGLIRLVGIHPNALLGVVGSHGNMPVERLRRSFDGRFLASTSHDAVVRFWDISYFDDEGEEDEADDPDAAVLPAGHFAAQALQQTLQPELQEQEREMQTPFFGGLL